MKKSIVNGILTLVILITLSISFILKESGFFRSIEPHFAGEIEVIPSPPGIEDLTIDHKTKKFYFSSVNRRDSDQRGDLFVGNIDNETFEFQNLTQAFSDSQFRPHGISLLNRYGKNYLFTISHRNNQDVVDRFEISNDSLIHHYRFTDDLLISPNDLLAIDTATFYFSNDHGLKPSPERRRKDFLLDKNGFIVLYDQGKTTVVSQKMAYPNGIGISPDHKYVYVTATTEKMVYVFEKDRKSHLLEFKDKHNTQSGVDNIEVDQFGNLIIGAHPKMLKFLGHATDSTKLSPSQILKVVYLPETNYKFLQEEIYLNDGTPLSGSSVGAYYQWPDGKNDLLVGSVFESKILRLHRKL